VFIATGSAIAIIVGNMLGAGKLNEVMDTTRKLITFGVLTSVFMGGLYIIASPFIPLLYNTEQNVRTLATGIMILSAIAMPFDSMAHSSYFTLRSGGKSLITFIFDCGFMWCVSVPLAFVLSHYTNLEVLTVFAIVQVVYFIKGFLGLALVRKGDWIRNIVND
jgi:Na+-driven multidrug efflux pump